MLGADFPWILSIKTPVSKMFSLHTFRILLDLNHWFAQIYFYQKWCKQHALVDFCFFFQVCSAGASPRDAAIAYVIENIRVVK